LLMISLAVVPVKNGVPAFAGTTKS
jgi:hypothetical protein